MLFILGLPSVRIADLSLINPKTYIYGILTRNMV